MLFIFNFKCMETIMKSILSILLIFSAVMFVSAQEQQQKVVHFKKLQSFLPTKAIDGYTRSKPTGSTQKNMGFSSSEIDFENEMEDGYKKTVTVAKNYKGIEKASADEYKSYSLNFAVGNKFHVTMEANGLDDVKMLYSLVEAMNLETLAKLTAE